MSEPAATTAAAPAKKKSKLPLLVACVVSIGGGAAFPMFVNVPALLGNTKDGEKAKAKPKAEGEAKTVTIPFDAAGTVVNLAEERATRYLKLKLALVVDADAEKEVTEKLAKKKPAMKSWLLIHLAGKTLKDVQGSVGASRVQREILERFEDILYPDGHGALRAVLFEEYVVQ
jgi:flagellar basal body-associated protein FliL